MTGTMLEELAEALQLENYRRDWAKFSACAGRHELPWFGVRAREIKQCRDVCRGCPVRSDCLSEAVGWLNTMMEQQGTMGGTTHEQRVWLATNPDTARQVAADCAEAGVDPDELAEYWEATGPDVLEGDNAREIAARYGIRYRRRQGQRRATPAPFKPVYTDDYEIAERVLRAAEPGEWVTRKHLRAVLMDELGAAHVEHLQTAHEHGRKGILKAMDSRLCSILESLERRGKITTTRDVTPGGLVRNVRVRWEGGR